MSFVPVDEPRPPSELRDLGRVRAPNIATSYTLGPLPFGL